MRIVQAAMVAATLSTPALADTWSGTEGVCNEWVTQWNMTKQPGASSYAGNMHGNQLAAPCSGSGGGIINGQATAVMSETDFSANRVTSPDNNTCNFHGRVSGDKVNGTYTCSNGGPFNFSLSK